MPGPVSDSFDPEWGTAANAQGISGALDWMHSSISKILHDAPPVHVTRLLEQDRPALITATLTEKQWRLIRFALERAREPL